MPELVPIPWSAGGPMMWVLALMAVVALVLFVERALYLRRGHIRTPAFVAGLKNILGKRRLNEALAVCEETPGPVASVVKTALRHAHDEETPLRFAVREAAILELPNIERRIGALAAIAQVAPLVGLLGTVVGMVTTFHAFMQGGEYATAKALAAGMWQALIVTGGSLLIGIPAHFTHAYLVGKAREMVRDIEWAANEMMRFLLVDYRAIKVGEDGVELGDGTTSVRAISGPVTESAPIKGKAR